MRWSGSDAVFFSWGDGCMSLARLGLDLRFGVWSEGVILDVILRAYFFLLEGLYHCNATSYLKIVWLTFQMNCTKEHDMAGK